MDQLGIDFGTSNTVIARWNQAREEGEALSVPGIGRQNPPGLDFIVPSLIHYASDGEKLLIGDLARAHRAEHTTFKNIKSFIRKDREGREGKTRNIGGGVSKSHWDAGKDFLTMLIEKVASEYSVEDPKVVFTLPVEAYEYYVKWLETVAQAVGMPRVQFIDEPSAAALGYEANIQPGQAYVVFDFGGGTLDVSVAVIQEEEEDSAARDRRCKIIGKAGTDIGGLDLDLILYKELLERNGKTGNDEDIIEVAQELIDYCEEAKIQLSHKEKAEITHMDDEGLVIEAQFTRAEFEELLDVNDILRQIQQTMRRALVEAAASREKVFEDDIAGVLMVGGSSLVPAVHKVVTDFFDRERVSCERPLDAVARGAASLAAGIGFFDHIQHTYALRNLDVESNEYEFTEIVKKGTAYPSGEALLTKKIKATWTGQRQFGIDIFELGEDLSHSFFQKEELVYDRKGRARISKITTDDLERRSRYWINEDNRTFLTIPQNSPTAKEGEERFQVEFNIDDNKRLLITAYDLREEKLIHRNTPVVNLI